jgi:hypothetical protein
MVGMRDPYVPLELDLNELEPVSELRPTGGRPATSLVVETGLRDADAATAWVTVSDEAGAVYFEGQPDGDGRVSVSFAGSPSVERVVILFETARLHRQAEVTLSEGTNRHAFG